LAFTSVGGWDTHVNQGGARGQLANRLGSLGEGLEALAQGLGEAFRDTVIVVQTTTRYVPLYEVGVPTFTYGQFIVTRPRGGKVTCPTCALS
jgi:hypothetical protein